MSAISDAEFAVLLKKDVEYFTRAVTRFENLLPSVCAPLQDQWRLQAQARKNFTLDLTILLQKAEECARSAVPGAELRSRDESTLA